MIDRMKGKFYFAIASTVILLAVLVGYLLRGGIPVLPTENDAAPGAEDTTRSEPSGAASVSYSVTEPATNEVTAMSTGEEHIVTGTLIAIRDDGEQTENADTGSIAPPESTEAESGENSYAPVLDPRLPQTLRDSRTSIGLNDEAIFAARISQNGLYHYDRLSEEEQYLYAELLLIMQKHAENIYISAMDAATLERVQNCVLNDHPEIFYVDGYYSTRYTLQEQTIGFSFSGRYTLDEAEIARRRQQIDLYVSNCLEGLPPDADDYTKVKYVYEYLIRRTDYLTAAPDNQNICSVFLYGKSVCQGYAKATQYILQQTGVPATLVVGTVRQSGAASIEGAHAWNLVQVDGDYYYVDTTWGDASFLGAEGQSEQSGIGYDFLNATTADISETHTIGSVVPMPLCDATAANYYVRENAYFNEADLDQLRELITRREGEGAESVTFKCGTEDVYRSMLDMLINRNMIFDLFHKAAGETVTYSRSDDKHTMTVWF